MDEKKQAPVVRQDLSLTKTEAGVDGSPGWILQDELSGRYFRLGQTQVELLPYVDGRSPAEVLAQYSIDYGEELEESEVEGLMDFLRKNNLVEVDATQERWLNTQRNQRPSLLAHMAKSYLFFRIPLFKPDNFLEKTLPLVSWLGSSWAIRGLIAIGVLGLILVLREFDSFQSTFMYFFNVQGLALFAIALVFTKILHELGHGYAAKACGCRVPTIGVAFLVLWPVLYTDTSDAWKIPSRAQRLKIDAAGISVELGIAALALLAWTITPEGPLRSVFFILATSTWLVSLAVNLNPLMRFDGYYLLSDAWNMPNLEPRSQELARWWLREALFGFNEAPPEEPQRRLIAFAIGVWIYRFFLFLGIALLVYNLFFKMLGILLFIVEIIYFIAAPIYRELKQWVQRRQVLRWNGATLRTTVLAGLLALAVFYPWNNSVRLPAIAQTGYQVFYAPADGVLQNLSVENRQLVQADAPLFEINSPELSFELTQVQRRLDELQWERESIGFDQASLDRALITGSEMKTQQQRLVSLGRQVERLSVQAPLAGRVTDINPDLRNSSWISEGEMILALADTQGLEFFAYPGENYLSNIAVGQKGVFYPEGGGIADIPVTVVEVEYFGIQQMEQLYSASVFGGGVPVRENERGELIPVTATYRIRLLPDEERAIPRVIRGTINLNVEARSIAARTGQLALGVLIRESGF